MADAELKEKVRVQLQRTMDDWRECQLEEETLKLMLEETLQEKVLLEKKIKDLQAQLASP